MIATTLALKRLVCRVLIGVMISTQLAIAAYACPGVLGTAVPEAAESAIHSTGAMMDEQDAMPAEPALSVPASHPGMDPTLPNLCTAHCQSGDQRADHAPAPVVSPALLVGLYTLVTTETAAEEASARAVSGIDGPPVRAEPPHVILHCCRRD